MSLVEEAQTLAPPRAPLADGPSPATPGLPRGPEPPGQRWTSHRPRAPAALLGLLAIYLLLIAAGGPRAWSGADAGSKVATARSMAVHRSWVPDVGYWAVGSDPAGLHHQLFGTRRAGNHWIWVTSLPLVYAGAALYRVGGLAGLLVVPLLGSLLAAEASRRLARLLGARTGWLAFWLVGVGSPMLFYAGDFWEHAPAVGLALLAVSLALGDGHWSRFVAAGLVAGMAAVLRSEVLIYAIAFAVAVALVAEERRRWVHEPSRLVGLVVGAAPVLVANVLLERIAFAGAAVREGRAGSNAAAAGSHGLIRLSNAALTSIGIFPGASWRSLCLGGMAVAGVAVGARRMATPRAPRSSLGHAVVGGGVLALGVRLAAGPGFIPGFATAAPLSASARPRSARSRVLVMAAVLALPAVWMLQWPTNEFTAQWGGRYVLLSGALLSVVAAAEMERLGAWRRPGGMALVALSVGVGIFGGVWHAQRARAVARAVASVEAVPADVVIVSGVAHLGQEAGGSYGTHRWLTGLGAGGLADAAAVARSAGARKLEVVEVDESGHLPAPSVPGFALIAARHVSFVGVPLLVDRYDAA
ncbi:MAG: hypothetical protein ACYDAD_04895 [Acidimicrobiales bacterium]